MMPATYLGLTLGQWLGLVFCVVAWVGICYHVSKVPRRKKKYR